MDKTAAELALLIRGALGVDGVLPTVTFDETVQSDVVISLDSEKDRAAQVKAALTSISLPAAIKVESIGTFAAAVSTTEGRLRNKIAIVTGGAQGFGAGIVEELLQEGARVMIADINEKAADFAEALNKTHGENRVASVVANVADEASVENMIAQTALTFGGVDIFVSNAGIVRSGSVKELSLKDFELVTKVNYEAFFLCTKYASKAMAATKSVAPTYSADIIQISSKSGLAGSNRNGAYAGSKFGGIGLVQSFALELIEDNIKVNAICPGNFFEGPLWSDPEVGLFRQYLDAGKIPGATTVDDVRKSYESKVPMGRGCLPKDVATAILYAVEQAYETGQAIPVTGGQIMLK